MAAHVGRPAALQLVNKNAIYNKQTYHCGEMGSAPLCRVNETGQEDLVDVVVRSST